VALFNDVITREAAAWNVPVMDLRVLFNSSEDYANAIEPSTNGGEKIAHHIRELMFGQACMPLDSAYLDWVSGFAFVGIAKGKVMFTVSISTDEAAFGDGAEDKVREVVAILQDMIPKLRSGVTKAMLHDSDGKLVGHFQLA
jgi:hypothetical protein